MPRAGLSGFGDDVERIDWRSPAPRRESGQRRQPERRAPQPTIKPVRAADPIASSGSPRSSTASTRGRSVRGGGVSEDRAAVGRVAYEGRSLRGSGMSDGRSAVGGAAYEGRSAAGRVTYESRSGRIDGTVSDGRSPRSPRSPRPTSPERPIDPGRAAGVRAPGAGVPGRRTVTIQGRGGERAGFRQTQSRRRPSERPYERAGFRPDRVAMWAVMLGVLLVLVAATSSHAAIGGVQAGDHGQSRAVLASR
jgi:hypothetical protein